MADGEMETGVGNGQAADGRPGNAGLKFRGAAGLEMPGRKSILRPKTGNRVQTIKKQPKKNRLFFYNQSCENRVLNRVRQSFPVMSGTFAGNMVQQRPGKLSQSDKLLQSDKLEQARRFRSRKHLRIQVCYLQYVKHYPEEDDNAGQLRFAVLAGTYCSCGDNGKAASQVGDKKISRKTGSDAGVDFPSGKKFSGKQQRCKQHHAQGFFCPQAESCEEQHNTDGGEG